MKQYKTYLFDADGTLIDTSELIFQSFLNTCRVYGGFVISRKEVYQYIGIPLRSQLELYLGTRDDREYEEILKAHRNYQKEIYHKTLKAYTGIKSGLEELNRRGVQLGIVSSRNRESLDHYLKHVGIFDYFNVFSTPDSTKNHKPHAEPVLWAMNKLHARADDTIFIGDADVDIKSGNSAGIDTAFVLWGHNSEEHIQSKPVYVINKFAELLN